MHIKITAWFQFLPCAADFWCIFNATEQFAISHWLLCIWTKFYQSRPGWIWISDSNLALLCAPNQPELFYPACFTHPGHITLWAQQQCYCQCRMALELALPGTSSSRKLQKLLQENRKQSWQLFSWHVLPKWQNILVKSNLVVSRSFTVLLGHLCTWFSCFQIQNSALLRKTGWGLLRDNLIYSLVKLLWFLCHCSQLNSWNAEAVSSLHWERNMSDFDTPPIFESTRLIFKILNKKPCSISKGCPVKFLSSWIWNIQHWPSASEWEAPCTASTHCYRAIPAI